LRQTFAYGAWDARRLAEFLDRHEAYFPASFSRPSFLDNHDMNRFLWSAKGEAPRLKLAALCQFTLAGPPIIYYGTEVGLSQERDVRQNNWAIHEEARLPMLWGEAQDTELLGFYRALCRIRTSEAALRRGARQTLFVDERVLAYRRKDETNSLVAVLNPSLRAAEVSLPIAERNLILATDAACAVHTEADGVRVSVPPLGGMLLKS